MKFVFGMVLVILLAGLWGCGAGAACPLDKNGDGQLTDADFEGMTQAQQEALYSQVMSDPLSFLPCLPMLESAMGSLPAVSQ
ncbi:MAG TPA: hypothetical protein PLC79_00350 [Phycisphaerae bacterium]|nr:hypothetical protein [Phycisphaerae bacterium]